MTSGTLDNLSACGCGHRWVLGLGLVLGALLPIRQAVGAPTPGTGDLTPGDGTTECRWDTGPDIGRPSPPPTPPRSDPSADVVVSRPLPGQSGVPTLAWGGIGVNELFTSGPYVLASVNGASGGGAVFLGSGGSFVSDPDFDAPLHGIDWGHRRIYTSKSSSSLDWQGEGWWASEMMNLTVSGSEGASDVSVEWDPHYTFHFTYSAGSWTCDDKYLLTLTFDSGNDEYTVTRPDGWAWTFHDSQAANAGQLKRIEDPYANDLAFDYDTNGQLDTVVADVVEGTDHKIDYSYFTSGDSQGLLQYVKVYKSTTVQDSDLIGQVEYAYHDASTDGYGLEDDLMKVVVSHKATNDGDGVLSIGSTTYYRYYQGAYDADTNPGTDHQVRYVLLPENADRLNTDKGNPLTQTNADFADYANVAYEYDANGRVRRTDERLPGAGCGCGGAGGTTGTITYDWTTNGGSPDLDTWNLHCVADRADDTRVIFDLNRVYQLLTWVVQNEDDGTPTLEDIWHFDYGTSGASKNRLTKIHYPSNCSAYDESSAPYTVTLRANSGFIHSLDYDYATNTYDGYLRTISPQHGTSDGPFPQLEYGRTISERPDLATTLTRHLTFDFMEEINYTTTYAYTFYDGDKYQPKQLTITHPSVSSGSNGPGASAVEYRFYDKRTGATRWTKDGEGYVNFYAYDDETGLRDLTVVDANTTTLLQVIDDNWDGVAHGGLGSDDAVPFSRGGAGTALDLDSSSTIDWLGRVRKTTDAEGMITYYVYKNDEIRAYPDWNTTNNDADLPIQVTKTDQDGRPEDLITLKTSVTPNTSGGAPIGTESYSNGDLVSRTVNTYNMGGALEHTDRYHDIPASGDGTRYTNYYRTSFVYDGMGRREYLAEDVADESTYDREQVTRTVYDFLGRQIEVKLGVSDNSHDLDLEDADTDGVPDSLPTLVTTVQYFFDDPDTDSTPEQGEGDGNLRWARRWYGSSGGQYHDTEHLYDWRDRRCVTRAPAAPHTLVAYDHLDRVTGSGRYSATTNLDAGDDPATTENGNRLGLSKTYYDEMSRVYKTEVFEDPGDATPGDALTTNTYHDRRSLVWAADAPNTGIQFTVYDGAGRRTQTLSGTQFDTNKYTSSAPDYPDDDEGLVQLTDYTLDEVGNVTKTVTKELNHDDTNGLDTDGTDFIRTYVYNYYDSGHRLTDTANWGTYSTGGWKDQGTAPAYDNDGGTTGDQPPTRSDTVLVTTYTYDTSGRRYKTTDPKAIDTTSAFDDLGRVTQKDEADGTAVERTTKYEYNGQGSLTQITADLATDQETEYVYADAVDSRWVTKIKYPNPSTGVASDSAVDRIVFTYNADGTLATRTDQNGTALTWSYDALRRKTEEEVTTVGSYTGGSGSVDDSVRAVTWTYRPDGKVEYLTTHSDTAPDTTNWTDAVNQVKYTYDAGGYLTKEEQDPDSEVGDNTGIDTRDVEYSYATDFTASGNYKRKRYTEYPDARKIWLGYTHTGAANTFEDTVNDKFSRVGQLAFDNSGSIGDLLAEYSFNGMGRMVRRLHDDDSGWNANGTRVELFGGTSGQYAGFDRFGRTVDLRHQYYTGAAWADFERRQYTYDRDGNRTSEENTPRKALSSEYTYDSLNRLTDAKKGVLLSGAVALSDVRKTYDLDLLGNLAGFDVNGTADVIAHTVNATNEITSVSQANPGGAAEMLIDPFTTSLSSMWSADLGTWSISSNKVNVDTLTSGEAVLLASPQLDQVNYSVEVTFPANSSTNKAGLVLAHDGDDSFYAVVLDRNAGKLALHQVTDGSWGSALASGTATINDSTAYTVKVFRKQQSVLAWVVGQAASELSYDSASDFGTGQSGLYSDKTGVTFDDFTATDGAVRDPLIPRFVGPAATSISSGALRVQSGTRGGEAAVENFADDDYMVDLEFGLLDETSEVWFRCQDANNGYVVRYTKLAKHKLYLFEVVNGQWTQLDADDYDTGAQTQNLKIKANGTSLKVWYDGTLEFNVSDGTHAAGGVALAGYADSTFDNLKIGYDNNADDDLNDAGDDLVVNTGFGSTSTTFAYDDAGNLVDDGTFIYVYDAWNRLVQATASEDTDVVIGQYGYDGQGRRTWKSVSNSGDLDGTELYYYTGHQVIEVRDGSENVVQQVVHGTRYIDEAVLEILADGVVWVHQDANWNVLALTDFAGRALERYDQTPYGIVTVDQESYFGDYDGDSLVTLAEVDSNTNGSLGAGDACWGSGPAGACRVLDFDFDEDVDAGDKTVFDALVSADTYRRPGRSTSALGHTRFHQGLIFDPEIGSFNNRARQYAPQLKRFMQRDPNGFREGRIRAVNGHVVRNWSDVPVAGTQYIDGTNPYLYNRTVPTRLTDPTGRQSGTCEDVGGMSFDQFYCVPNPPPPGSVNAAVNADFCNFTCPCGCSKTCACDYTYDWYGNVEGCPPATPALIRIYGSCAWGCTG